MNFDRQNLETFAVVVEFRNFGKAARALNVTRSAVSQRIIALERKLGAPLLVREEGVPTPAGEALLRHIQVLHLLEADTLQQIKPGENGRIKIAIAVNADSLATWFEPIACSIAKWNFSLELIVDDQDYTLPVLARGEAMGCISTANVAPTGFVAEHIGAMDYECVATPEFSASNFNAGFNLHEVLNVPAVLYNRKDALHASFLERVFGFQVSGYPQHYFPSPDALLTAIKSGVGYGLAPAMQVSASLDSGELVTVAPHAKIAVDLYWHHWKVALPNAMAISDAIVRQARQTLSQSGSSSHVAVDKEEKAD